MIEYDGGKYQVSLIFQLHGSVFPKACVFAVPATIVAICFHIVMKDWNYFEFEEDFLIMENNAAYSGFSFVVGFLLVFRTSQAYTRFWEGTTLMQILRGQWVGAFSSILAFTSTSLNDRKQIEEFRHKLVRLFSLLHANALRYTATLSEEEEEFDIIGILGLDDRTIQFIHGTSEDTKIYVTVQWIQQLIIANLNTGILPVPAPIISRVFQDLSQGIVTLNNARKISDTPFPFPYVQMVTLMLVMHMGITPFIVSSWCDEWYWSAAFTFAPVFAFWSINFIAAEIEQPFGGDVNDINVADLQTTMNKCLVAMLDPRVSLTPCLRETVELDREKLIEKADTLSAAHFIAMRSEVALGMVKPINRKISEILLETPLAEDTLTTASTLEAVFEENIHRGSSNPRLGTAALEVPVMGLPPAVAPSNTNSQQVASLRPPPLLPAALARHDGPPGDHPRVPPRLESAGSRSGASLGGPPEAVPREREAIDEEAAFPQQPQQSPSRSVALLADNPPPEALPPESRAQSPGSSHGQSGEYVKGAPGRPPKSDGDRDPKLGGDSPNGPQPLHLSVDAEGFSLRMKAS